LEPWADFIDEEEQGGLRTFSISKSCGGKEWHVSVKRFEVRRNSDYEQEWG
jgi:hypothetical protein